MSEKTDKSSHKKKSEKLVEGRKFAVISPRSVLTLAESCGITGLSEDIASRIGEDVTYRLREIIQGCCVHMRNNSERILKSTDVAKVLPNCSEMQICGYASGGSSDFIHIPEANVFVNQGDRTCINLPSIALNIEHISEDGDLFINGMWYVPDNTTEGAPIIGLSSASSSESSITSIAPYLTNYFSTIAKVILCKHSKALHCVLQDLRTNPNIALVVPYFMNLLIEGLLELPKGSDACEHLLQMLHSLALNPSYFRDASVVISGLITALLTYAVHPTPFEMTNLWRDLELREIAAEGISKVLQYWYGSDESMLCSIVEKVKLISLNPCSSQRSHYGSLVVLCSLSNTALYQGLWLHFEEFIKIIDQFPSDQDRLELEGCILKAAGILYHSAFTAAQNFQNFIIPIQRLAVLDSLMYSQFGDAICAQRRFSLCSSSVSKVAHWSKCTYQHFLDLLSEEKCRNSDSKTGASLKTEGSNKKAVRGTGTMSEAFEFLSVLKLPDITISSIRGLPSWNKKLLKKRYVCHQQFLEPSSYFLKSSRLKPVGRMTSSHLYSSHLNLSGVLSTSL